MATVTAMDRLKTCRPEWAPWLAVVEEIVRETATSRWAAAVPAGVPTQEAATPLLAGAVLDLEAEAIRGLFQRLVGIAASSETSKMATLRAVVETELDALELFTASLCQDRARLGEVARASGADSDALQAVAALLPVPFLQACRHAWASAISRSWVEGYCPVCGAWPAFAEVRGIERARYFRCGRCGGAWHARLLNCPYCAERDHGGLVSLVPENGGTHAVIDACKRCSGYVKAFTRLQGCAPDAVMLEDLASVELDVAAVELGYTRPAAIAYPLQVTLIDRGAARSVSAGTA
jgi:FdhE protein